MMMYNTFRLLIGVPDHSNESCREEQNFPVLIPYSTLFVYRASRLKRAPCLIFWIPAIVINVISYNVWFLPIFPLTLFSPLVEEKSLCISTSRARCISLPHRYDLQTALCEIVPLYTICIISIKTVHAIHCIYLTAIFIKLNSTLFTVHLDQENSFLDLL